MATLLFTVSHIYADKFTVNEFVINAGETKTISINLTKGKSDKFLEHIVKDLKYDVKKLLPELNKNLKFLNENVNIFQLNVFLSNNYHEIHNQFHHN